MIVESPKSGFVRTYLKIKNLRIHKSIDMHPGPGDSIFSYLVKNMCTDTVESQIIQQADVQDEHPV